MWGGEQQRADLDLDLDLEDVCSPAETRQSAASLLLPGTSFL